MFRGSSSRLPRVVAALPCLRFGSIPILTRAGWLCFGTLAAWSCRPGACGCGSSGADDVDAFERFARSDAYLRYLGDGHPDPATFVANNVGADGAWVIEL